jgi:membrane fusion protein, multidrug efflux system
MRTCTVRLFLLVLGALATCTPALADVELNAEKRENLGIRTEPAREIEAPRNWLASGLVVDSAPLITALGELHAAESGALASRAEAERSERLYRNETNIARKALDAARAQAIADANRVKTAKAQLLGAWGRAVGTMSEGARTQLVEDLLAGHASLIRAELLLPLPADAAVSGGRVSTLDSRQEWAADWLGALPQTTNATLAGASLLRVAASLPVGQPLQAALLEKSPSVRGLSVPAAAIVRWRGLEWVYEESAPNHFTRRGVREGVRVTGRSLLASGTKGPVNVVIVGARALLAAEQGAAASEDAAQAGE